MSIIKDLQDAKQGILLAYLIIIFSLILPGILITAFYRYDFFITINVFKLILLAMSFTFSFFLFNCILVGISMEPDDPASNVPAIAASGGILVDLNFYLSLLVSYFFKFSIKEFLIIVLVLQGLILLIFIIDILKKHKESKKRIEKNNQEIG